MKKRKGTAMKTILTATCYLFAVAASAATLRLAPGLSAPDVADGVRLDAAVLVSTNATATAQVAAVYELPEYGTAESVTVVTNDHYVLSTNVVIGTNSTLEVTDLYTLATNPTDRVTELYTVQTNAGIVATNYLYIATNYWTVWTNSWPVMVNRPTVAEVTNRLIDVTGYKPITNALFSLTAEGGYAETNSINRWLVSPARLLVTGSPITLILSH